MSTTSIGRLRQHVEDLAAEHDIVVGTWVPINSVISYAVALHEIGHIRGRFQRSSHSLVREQGAWAWARQNALVWTDRMERYAITALARIAPSGRNGRW